MTHNEMNIKIIEDTILSTNRVIAVWVNSNKKTDYADIHSAFKNFFVKYIKQHFGWKYYSGLIRRYEYIPIIENNKVIGISYNKHENLNEATSSLNNVIDSFDFLKFNDLNPIELKPTIKEDTFKPSNFEHLTNIKF